MRVTFARCAPFVFTAQPGYGASTMNFVDRHLGARLRELRRSREMDISALAAELHVHVEMIKQFERGERRIDAATLYMLTQLFNVPVRFFYRSLSERLQKTIPMVKTTDSDQD